MFDSVLREDIPPNHPIVTLDTFWKNEAKGAGSVPWSVFDPMKMSSVLPWVLLLDCLPGKEYRYRLCGTGCEQLLGLNLTGEKFGANVDQRWAKSRLQEFSVVESGRGPAYSSGNLPLVDREHIRVYRALYGFSVKGTVVDRILAVVAPPPRHEFTSLGETSSLPLQTK